MNKRRVATYAAALAFGAAPALGDDDATKPLGQTDTQRAADEKAGIKAAKEARGLPTTADKKRAVETATRGFGMQPPSAKPLIGDFPPYGGQSVDEWRTEQKRRSDREYERLEKLTPKQQDEESAERKRRQQEWQKMRPQENNPAK